VLRTFQAAQQMVQNQDERSAHHLLPAAASAKQENRMATSFI
jgi:hypothetical protein